MTEYEIGFQDAFDSMRILLDRLELKAMQCLELSKLMNMMNNWGNARSLLKNIKFTQEKMEEVKNEYYLMRRFG